MSTTQELLEANAALRREVAARLAGCRPAQEAAVRTLADAGPPPEVPAEFAALHPGATWTTATPIPAMTLDEPVRIAASLPPAQLEATARAMRPRERRAGPRLVGIAGRAGAGKDLVASMIPGAWVIGLADPLYAMLAAMLRVSVDSLRDRGTKELPIEWLGRSPRHLLQTLGTEWGREHVAQDVWMRLAAKRADDMVAAGVRVVVVADVRFPDEAAWIRDRGGEVWHLRRPGTDAPSTHVTEAGVAVVGDEPVIVNDGTIEDLRRTVEKLLYGRT